MKTRAIASAPERDAPLGEISEPKLGTLRLRTPELLSALERRSCVRACSAVAELPLGGDADASTTDPA